MFLSLIKKSFASPDVHHYKDVEQSNIWGHKELKFIKQKIILTSGSRQMLLVNSGTELVITWPWSWLQMSSVVTDVHYIDLKSQVIFTALQQNQRKMSHSHKASQSPHFL